MLAEVFIQIDATKIIEWMKRPAEEVTNGSMVALTVFVGVLVFASMQFARWYTLNEIREKELEELKKRDR